MAGKTRLQTTSFHVWTIQHVHHTIHVFILHWWRVEIKSIRYAPKRTTQCSVCPHVLYGNKILIIIVCVVYWVISLSVNTHCPTRRQVLIKDFKIYIYITIEVITMEQYLKKNSMLQVSYNFIYLTSFLTSYSEVEYYLENFDVWVRNSNKYLPWVVSKLFITHLWVFKILMSRVVWYAGTYLSVKISVLYSTHQIKSKFVLTVTNIK